MRPNALQLLAVCCLVALAGCTGALSGGGDGPTLDDVSYPPGVSENGTNVSALADAHSAALENRSFALSANSTVNAPTANESVRLDASVGRDRENVLVNATLTNQQVSMYLTAEKRYTRISADGEVSYQANRRTSDAVKLVPSSFTGAGYLDRFGGIANFTPTGVREVDGTTLVVLRADGSNATASEQANVTDYNATLLVDEQGVVRSMTVEATSTLDGRQSTTAFSLEISNVGETTVAEPAWLDEARNQTGD